MTIAHQFSERFERFANGSPAELQGGRQQLSAASVTLLISVGLLLFWVYGDRPLVGDVWEWADDGLYLRQAEAILRWLHGGGQPWLGPYDAVVLGKTPLFPMWLAAVHILRVPLRIAEFGLLLGLPWLFHVAVRPVRYLSTLPLIAAALLLSGLPFLPHEQRLLRTALQAALTSGCQIASLGLILRVRRRDMPIGRWAALTGLLFGLAYLNREEAIWLLPVMFCSLAAILVVGWWHRSWRDRLRATACLAIMSVLPIALTAAMNYRAYGIFVTTVRRAPEFTRAHQVMTSLEPATRRHNVPIGEATRLKAYMLSPTFARLSVFLEGPAGDDFARNSAHLSANGWPATAREFFVSNFQFALQQAAFQAGAQSAQAFEALFKAISDELELAIAHGQISAGNRGPALFCAALPGDVRLIVKQSFLSLRKLYTLDGLTFPAEGVSTDTPEDRQRLGNMTRTVVAPTETLKRLDLPQIGARARHLTYDVINRLVIVLYVAGTGGLLILITATAVRHRPNLFPLDQALAGFMLCGSLVTFSVAIAVADVLGVVILAWSPAPYNYMGNAPLSVLSAFGIVVLLGWLRPLSVHDAMAGATTVHHRVSFDARNPA